MLIKLLLLTVMMNNSYKINSIRIQCTQNAFPPKTMHIAVRRILMSILSANYTLIEKIILGQKPGTHSWQSIAADAFTERRIANALHEFKFRRKQSRISRKVVSR